MLRDQFIGNRQGLTELQRILDDRKETLTAILKQQELDEQAKHHG